MITGSSSLAVCTRSSAPAVDAASMSQISTSGVSSAARRAARPRGEALHVHADPLPALFQHPADRTRVVNDPDLGRVAHKISERRNMENTVRPGCDLAFDQPMAVNQVLGDGRPGRALGACRDIG